MSPYRVFEPNLHGHFAEVHRGISRRSARLLSPTTDRVGAPLWSLGLSGSSLTRPNNETSRKMILVGRGEGEGRVPMGFFARRLTTISIVYDFNNLGAALLARLDTFSVVNRATKSVFMGKRWQQSGAAAARLLPTSRLLRPTLVPTLVVAQNEGEPPDCWRTDRKGPRRETRGWPSRAFNDWSIRGLSHEKTSLVYIFARVHTREGALRRAIYIH